MDERYEMTIGADHASVRLRDMQTGEIHKFTGARALFDALGKLAEWRERGASLTGECSCEPHPIFGHRDGCRYEGMGR